MTRYNFISWKSIKSNPALQKDLSALAGWQSPRPALLSEWSVVVDWALGPQAVSVLCSARSDFYAGLQPATVGKFSELDSPVQSSLSCPALGTWLQTPPAIYLFPSVITSLTLVNSYFHHNQTRPRTKNHKNTQWILYWINHRPAEFTSILGNDKNDKEDLILKANNYKIMFEI